MVLCSSHRKPPDLLLKRFCFRGPRRHSHPEQENDCCGALAFTIRAQSSLPALRAPVRVIESVGPLRRLQAEQAQMVCAPPTPAFHPGGVDLSLGTPDFPAHSLV